MRVLAFGLVVSASVIAFAWMSVELRGSLLLLLLFPVLCILAGLAHMVTPAERGKQ